MNSEITAERQVRFFAFSLESADDVDLKNSHEETFKWMEAQGFEVVPYYRVTADNVEETVALYAKSCGF